jgi:hypothetical protein
MQQYGYVELFLARETAAKNIRFRNLGWEGDTVFEQRRELNFPSWEQTLTKIGATVIVAQFGQAESLRGREPIPQFRQATVNLLSRLAGTNRRVIVLAPTRYEAAGQGLPDLTSRNGNLAAYVEALRESSQARNWLFIDLHSRLRHERGLTRDGLHLNALGHWRVARELARVLSEEMPPIKHGPASGCVLPSAAEQLRQAIIAKNQLWFDYWRPQNWAFLAGDRTEQPSSRDHRNPKVRWFPNELEQFLPLIEAKEREVRGLAGKLP